MVERRLPLVHKEAGQTILTQRIMTNANIYVPISNLDGYLVKTHDNGTIMAMQKQEEILGTTSHEGHSCLPSLYTLK